jgi:parallel beta-helix repeat protein
MKPRPRKLGKSASLFARSNHPGQRRRQSRMPRLAYEPLEVRALLTTLTVDIADPNCGDPGDDLYCQIQDAENEAIPGDQIEVAPGTYLPVVIDVNDITIEEATSNANPVIDATGSDSGVVILANGVTIGGLEVNNATSNGFLLIESSGNTLNGNTAMDNASGFDLLDSDNNILIGNSAANNERGFFLVESSGNCPGPATLYTPFGWADMPIPPPNWVVKNRWTRSVTPYGARRTEFLAGTAGRFPRGTPGFLKT